jgi:O-antigen/teichoic acid export membrane protein
MLRDFLPGISRVFANITPIIIFFIFARILSIEELGLINYLIAFITIIGLITDFGIPEAIQRFLPQVKTKANLISYAIKAEMLIVFIAATFFFILESTTSFNLSKDFLFPLTLTIIFSASNTIILIFNGLEDKKRTSIYFLLSSTIFFLTTFFFYFIVKLDPGISFILGRLISWVIYTILPLTTLIKEKYLQKSEFDLIKKKEFNTFALNTFVYIGGITIITQWDSILITHIDGTYINGIYKSVAFIATIPIVFVTILQTKLLPYFSKLNGLKDYKTIKNEINKYVKYLAIILTLSYLIQITIYEPILLLFLNEEIVLQAGHLFPMIFLAICLQIIATPFIVTLQALGESRIIRNIMFFQVLLFLTISTNQYECHSYEIFPKLLLIFNTASLLLFTLFTYTKLRFCNINKICPKKNP